MEKIDNIKYNEVKNVTNFVKFSVNEENFIIQLYDEIAPITVENFKNLVEKNFYTNLIFHRIIEDFMIQGGDPKGNGTGGSKKTIKGEFTSNGIENELSHEIGVISMARSMKKNSASSQFFICTGDATFLDGDYAAFGKVIAGIDKLMKFNKVSTNKDDIPQTEVKINSIVFVELEK